MTNEKILRLNEGEARETIVGYPNDSGKSQTDIARKIPVTSKMVSATTT